MELKRLGQKNVALSQQNTRVVPCFFREARHLEEIAGIRSDFDDHNIWHRFGKERMKTVSVALCLCLNVGVDPPDPDPKPNPCSRLEAWFDPFSCNPTRAAQRVAIELQKAYERWQPRARYKALPDPTLDDVRKVCQSMRRNAKEERILFHYNGHGVPRPTANGEIWVFNKHFTQYIPLSLYDLQTWMGSPSVYVWDCANSEIILQLFHRFAEDHVKEWESQVVEHVSRYESTYGAVDRNLDWDKLAEMTGFRRKPNFKDCVLLGATKLNERLPVHPDLPADLFTSCLTTPIQTSLLWALIASKRRHQFPSDFIDKLPGQLTDRRTVLGELNWIFTAITDTIAWNSLPRDLFQKLFRQDLLLASLLRSFLLAQRLMGFQGCHVVSTPSLPVVVDHPLWSSWDMTLDIALEQIRAKLGETKDLLTVTSDCILRPSRLFRINTLIDLEDLKKRNEQEPSQSWFFVDQLKAFEVWLEYGIEQFRPPQELPVVLQVLLSQVHRLRALELLARFVDLGEWAVGHALSVGVFPYVLKLLQSGTRELRPWLAFVWAKILAVDPSCQAELFKENGDERYDSAARKDKKELRFNYFLTILNDTEKDVSPMQKVVPAFIIATLIHDQYKPGQQSLCEKGYVNTCTELLSDPEASQCKALKLWLLIGLGRLWADYDDARWQAIRLVAYPKVIEELEDNVPEVRAAAVYALGRLVKNRSNNNEHAATVGSELCATMCAKCAFDGSILVRTELVVALQWFVLDFETRLMKLVTLLHDNAKVDDAVKEFKRQQEAEKVNGELGMDRGTEVMTSSLSTDRLTPIRDTRTSGVLPARIRSSLSFHRMLSSSSAEQGRGRSSTEESDAPALKRPKTQEEIAQEHIFRVRTQTVISYLERKQFTEPLERTWLYLCHLALDPIVSVAEKAQKVLNHVEGIASDMRARKKAKELAYQNAPLRTRAEREAQRQATGTSRVVDFPPPPPSPLAAHQQRQQQQQQTMWSFNTDKKETTPVKEQPVTPLVPPAQTSKSSPAVVQQKCEPLKLVDDVVEEPSLSAAERERKRAEMAEKAKEARKQRAARIHGSRSRGDLTVETQELIGQVLPPSEMARQRRKADSEGHRTEQADSEVSELMALGVEKQKSEEKTPLKQTGSAGGGKITPGLVGRTKTPVEKLKAEEEPSNESILSAGEGGGGSRSRPVTPPIQMLEKRFDFPSATKHRPPPLPGVTASLAADLPHGDPYGEDPVRIKIGERQAGVANGGGEKKKKSPTEKLIEEFKEVGLVVDERSGAMKPEPLELRDINEAILHAQHGAEQKPEESEATKEMIQEQEDQRKAGRDPEITEAERQRQARWRESRRMQLGVPSGGLFKKAEVLMEQVNEAKEAGGEKMNQDPQGSQASSTEDDADEEGAAAQQQRQEKAGIRFVIGSEGAPGTSSSPPRRLVVPRPKFSTIKMNRDFAPKRTQIGRLEWSPFNYFATFEHAPVEPKAPLVNTEFVAWCGRVFSEPILHMFDMPSETRHPVEQLHVPRQRSADFDTMGLTPSLPEDVKNLKMLSDTAVNPTDWAIYVDEGLVDASNKEFESLKAGDGNTQLFAANCSTQPRCVTWSRLRPYVYASDAKNILLFRCDGFHSNLLARRFSANGVNNFNVESVSSLQLINGVSKEMLVAGSPSGLIRIFDLCFNAYSYDFDGEEKLVTAANILAGLKRITSKEHPENYAIYRWEQTTGQLVVGGNVRVCRVWDAHAEAPSLDMELDVRKAGALKFLDSDLARNNLIAVGYENGLVQMRDTRLYRLNQAGVCHTTHVEGRLAGVVLRVDSAGNPTLTVSNEAGEVSVWEPRNFGEPMLRMQVCDQRQPEILTQMTVHPNGRVLACATSAASVKLFDISSGKGRSLSHIRCNEACRSSASSSGSSVVLNKRCMRGKVMGRNLAQVIALEFHPLRFQLATATKDRFVSAYGLPSLANPKNAK